MLVSRCVSRLGDRARRRGARRKCTIRREPSRPTRRSHGRRPFPPRRIRPRALLAALGGEMFRDPSLSASGRVSCATCHDPAHAFGLANALAVQLAAPLRTAGHRAVPSLKYLQAVPPFTEHFFESETKVTAAWTTGLRAASPGTAASIVRAVRPGCRFFADSRWPTRRLRTYAARVARAPYAADSRRCSATRVLDDPEDGHSRSMGVALETYLQDARDLLSVRQQVRCVLSTARARSPPEETARTRGVRRSGDAATARAVTSAGAAPTAPRRSSPTTAWSRSACRATRRSRRTRIR